jgi:cytoskeletal protein CcmA (bactofilin family)
MFGKSKDGLPEELKGPAPVQHLQRGPAAQPVQFAQTETASDVSSISKGMTIVGKIAGAGTVKIFGRVQGELHAATVLISDGAEIEGDVVAEELTVGGSVKGTIRANRVKLVSTASVEGDIFHRSLAIEENARFEGTSRRDTGGAEKGRAPFARPQIAAQAPAESSRRLNSAPEAEAKVGTAVG